MTTQELVAQGFTGYTGWGDAEAAADFAATGGSGKGSPKAPQSVPNMGQSQPQPTPSYAPPAQSGQPQSAQDLVNMGFHGYAGWGNAEALADYKATSGSGKGSLKTGGMFSNQSGLDLNNLYESAYADAGIAALETKITEVQEKINLARQDLAKATGLINENPFVSEASRVGRIRKLQELANDTINNYILEMSTYQDQVVKKKADIETKLNIQLKQFDINSQQTQQALNQFNALLSMGALNNASASDIAQITQVTGLSSNLISSAIQAQKISGYQTSIQSFDDGKNQGFKVFTIDQYGNIVNSQSQVVGPSSSGGGSSLSFGGSDWEVVPSSQNISSLWNDVLTPSSSTQTKAPMFSPTGGVGTVYTDPATGVRFKYTARGWEQI